MKSEWLTAEDACALLGIKRATLYAYASRGRVRSRASGGTRRRHYARTDLEQLRARREARSGHGAVAAAALRWGEPVVDSALTEIRPDGHRYRGRAAHDLYDAGVSFEQTAEHLWDAPRSSRWPRASFAIAPETLASLIGPHATPIDAMAIALPALATTDPSRLIAAREPNLVLARRLVRLSIAATALPFGARRARASLREASSARAFAVSMGVSPSAQVVASIELALVLLADHELNPSSFAARVAASTRADLYACVGAALATLSGPRHGGMGARVEALLDEIAHPERAARVVGERLRRGDRVPGFGHPLYPGGDPRFEPFFAAAQRGRPSRRLRTLEALVDSMRLVGADHPTVDIGLAAIAATLRLPAGGSTALFAVARTVGWIAHALEQREAGFLVRPRARYVGP
jgi:citrate synthase